MEQKYFYNFFALIIATVLFSACSNEFARNGQTNYWLKHQYNHLNYIDTNQLESKAVEAIISAETEKLKGNFAMAILDYYQSLRIDTTSAILYAIADCYNRLDKHDLAIEYALLSLKNKTDFLPAYEILAKAYIEKFDIKNAIIALENAVKIEQNEQILYNLAQFYEYQDAEKAKKTYLELIEKFNNEDALERYIEFAKLQNNTEKYIEILEKFWQKSQKNFLLATELAFAWITMNQLQQLVDNIDVIDANFTVEELSFFYKNIINKIIQGEKNHNIYSVKNNENSMLNSEKNSVVINEENENFSKNKRKILQKIDNRFRFDSQMNFLAGNLSLLLPDTILAHNFFNISTESYVFDDENLSQNELNISIALAYFEYGFKEKSKQILIDFYAENPQFWGYPYMLGLLERQTFLEKNANVLEIIDSNNQKQIIQQKSLEYLTVAYNLDTSQVEILAVLGDIYSEIGNYEKSDDFYNKALLLEPNEPTICNNFAFSISNRYNTSNSSNSNNLTEYLDLTTLDFALKLSQKSLDFNPNSAEYLDTYGWINFKLGDYEKALKFIKKSIEINPQNSEVFEHLSDIYVALNNFVEAKNALDKAIEIAPFNEKLINKRSLLQIKN